MNERPANTVRRNTFFMFFIKEVIEKKIQNKKINRIRFNGLKKHAPVRNCCKNFDDLSATIHFHY